MNEKQYVIVRVESEHYAIEISKVNSITQMMEPTKVPNMAMYTEGVINLRGEVVPLLNFRKLFNVKGVTILKRVKSLSIKVMSEAWVFLWMKPQKF